MIAVRNKFVHFPSPPIDDERAFAGDWLLDRVSGLVDSAATAIQRLQIDARALHIELRSHVAGSVVDLSAEVNGEATELSVAGERFYVQALFEADALIWELEYQGAHGCARVRRVMRSSKQGSQLIAERVDLNPDGAPIAVRTEYWTRAGRPRAARDSLAVQSQ